MWEVIASMALKVPDLLLRLADRTRIKITVKHLEYDLIKNEPDSSVVFIDPYPSRYYARLGISHSGKPTTIKSLVLVIGGELKLEVRHFEPMKLEHGDYREVVVVFSVKEDIAVTGGSFELQAIDTFDKVYRFRGRFPIVPDK